MAINFKLRPVIECPPEDDPLGRTWYGWQENTPDEVIFEYNRAVWAIGRRAESQKYATYSYEGIVRVVAEIEGIEIIPGSDGKKAIVGRVLKPGDEGYELWHGKPVDKWRAVVTYLPEADADDGQ